MTMAHDVIVVGAGPAGSLAAYLLASSGHRVAILDKAARPPQKVCGEYLSPGARRILERIEALPHLLEGGARPLRGMLIHTRRGSTLRAHYPPSEGDRGDGLSVRRDLLDPVLLRRAREAGAELRFGFQVSEVLMDGGQFQGVEGREDGRPARLTARILLGADGRASVVARRLGPVHRHRRLDKIAVSGYFTGIERADDLGEIFLGRARYAITNPLSPELTNIALVADRPGFESIHNPTAFLAALGETHPELLKRLAGARPVATVRSLGPLAHRAARLSTPSTALIGDAAGFLDPFTGEGIFTALRSAELAAERAIRTLAGEKDGLEGYGAAWSREFLPKWRICMALQHAIRRPRLAEWIAARLATRPLLASYLMAVAGDLVPPGELGWPRLIGRLLKRDRR
jgi:flavin-dependent dehydrogenase